MQYQPAEPVSSSAHSAGTGYKLSTRDRLAEWRVCSYRKPDETLPPSYFRGYNEPSVTREEDKAPLLNYGAGLGADDPERPGFRFVGFADKVIDLNHTGWFGDDEGTGYSVLRGVVFQLPARKGQTRYLAGVEWGENGARGKFDTGGGWIEFGRGDVYESKEDAARAADSMAEDAADEEREYERDERARIEQEEEDAADEERANHAERMEFTDITGGGD